MHSSGLSHLNHKNQPHMVDVHAKSPTLRTAVAQGELVLGDNFPLDLNSGEIHSPKGPVIQTAVVAGIMAVKKTPELIPMCHSLPVDHCHIDIQPEPGRLIITCEVRVFAKTGVEMEALTGVSAAALTLYDMLKALGHGMTMQNIRLISKTGGKKDYHV